MLIPASAYAEIYKWTNDKGEVIYSERKPPESNIAVKKITPRSPAINQSTATEQTVEKQETADTDATPAGGVEERAFEDPAQDKLDQEIREKNCAMAKARFISLQRPRVNDVNEDGSLRRVGEDERQTKIKEASAAKNEWCS